MAKPKLKPLVSVAKSVALMNMRRKHLDHVELVRKLNAVGETQRAALLHGNVHQDAQRMQGELRAAEQPQQEPPPQQAYAEEEEPAHEQVFKLARLFGSRLADMQQAAKHVRREKTRALIRNNLFG